MANFRLSSLLFLLFTIALFSCTDDGSGNVPDNNYDKGILIVNEGPFQNGTGTVSHYDRITGKLTEDIFSLANNGAKIGNVLQSASNWQGKTYLMVNNANRVYIVDPKTFKYQDSIKGITQPRYFQGISAQKAYISSWSQGVNVVDLANKQITKTIKTGIGADKMLLDINNLYVLNSGGFEKDSTITLIEVLTDKVIKTIKAAPGPNSIEKAGGSIWVLCGSYWDIPGNGALIEYKLEQKVNEYKVPKYASNLVLSSDGKDLYFLAGSTIYKKSTLIASQQPEIFLNRKFISPYALDKDPITGSLLMADAGDFAVKSKVYFINPDTKIVKDSIVSGVATNSFIFGN
ncbi:MAG: YncE family protein [Saprospiraceae bacterium]